MINPLHIIAVLSLLAGWHLDAVDQALIECNQHKLAALNVPTQPPPILDNLARRRPSWSKHE